MNTPQPIATWIEQRILYFFNTVQHVHEITGTLMDNPTDGSGRTMGNSTASRVLRVRNSLPNRQFRTFAELDQIPGVGPGTIRDMVFTFGIAADTAFRNDLYDEGVLMENWALEPVSVHIADKARFAELVRDEAALRAYLVEYIEALGNEHELPQQAVNSMTDALKTAYIDRYHNSTTAPAYAMALWFYRFDADNWFSWEEILEHTQGYFEYHQTGYPWEMELLLFKGFEQQGIIEPGISPRELPVVLNTPEQVVTMWFSALYD